MPLYEYRCTSCGYTFEKIQSFSAEPERECPKCHGVLIRPVTAPALRFEGAGWYVNDYAGKSAAKSGDSPASGASEAASSKESADSKSAGSKGAGSKSGASDGGGTATPAAAAAAPASPSGS